MATTHVCTNIILAGANVNKADKSENGYTPLMKNKHYTALMLAAECDHSECVQLLLKSGATVNNKNVSGSTALYLAAHHRMKVLC